MYSGMTPVDLRKVLKKNGIDSPRAGRKSITPEATVDLLRLAGKLDVGQEVDIPRIRDTLFFTLPRKVLMLPVRLFSGARKEGKNKEE